MNGNSQSISDFNADSIAKQKLHVMLVVDTSRSMKGSRIGQVNTAISNIHKYLTELQGENTNVDFYLSIMTFSNEANFLPGYKGVNVHDMTPPRLDAVGYSNLHRAYEELAPVLRKESCGGMMPDFGGVAPIILLLTDGHPTKTTTTQLDALKKLPWFREAVRYGIAIELHDQTTVQVLTDFTGDRDCVIECIDTSTLAKIIQVIVLTASKVKSQSSTMQISDVARVQTQAAASPIGSAVQSTLTRIKQEVKQTLDEIDDWEW